MNQKEKRRWKRFWVISVLLILLAFYQSYLIFWGRAGVLSPILQVHQSENESSLLRNGDLFISLSECEELETYEYMFMKVDRGSSDYQALFVLLQELLKENLSQISVVDETVDSENVLPVDETVVVMNLGFMMNEEGIRDELDLGGGRFPAGTFDQIWITPAKSLADEIRFYFYNSHDKTMKTATGGVYTQKANRELLSEMIRVCENGERDYLWSGGVFDDIFGFHSFIPLPKQSQMGIGFFKPGFSSDQSADLKEMKAYGMSYFEYPDTVNERVLQKTEDSDYAGLILANEKLTLRMYPDGRVVYLETLTDLEKDEIPLSDAYDIAEAFLKKDLERYAAGPLQVVFAGYEKHGPRTVFYYDYQLEDSTLLMDASLSKSWGWEHPIRIEIYGSGVRAYNRYVADASIVRSRESAYHWIQMMDRMVQMGTKPMEPPKIVYVQMGEQLVPMWQVQTENGMVYFFA